MKIQNIVTVMHCMTKFWLMMGHIFNCGPVGSCHLSLVSELHRIGVGSPAAVTKT